MVPGNALWPRHAASPGKPRKAEQMVRGGRLGGDKPQLACTSWDHAPLRLARPANEIKGKAARNRCCRGCGARTSRWPTAPSRLHRAFSKDRSGLRSVVPARSARPRRDRTSCRIWRSRATCCAWRSLISCMCRSAATGFPTAAVSAAVAAASAAACAAEAAASGPFFEAGTSSARSAGLAGTVEDLARNSLRRSSSHSAPPTHRSTSARRMKSGCTTVAPAWPENRQAETSTQTRTFMSSSSGCTDR